MDSKVSILLILCLRLVSAYPRPNEEADPYEIEENSLDEYFEEDSQVEIDEEESQENIKEESLEEIEEFFYDDIIPIVRERQISSLREQNLLPKDFLRWPNQTVPYRFFSENFGKLETFNFWSNTN